MRSSASTRARKMVALVLALLAIAVTERSIRYDILPRVSTIEMVLPHFLFLQGDGHLWTIPQEMFFYLLLLFVMPGMALLLRIRFYVAFICLVHSPWCCCGTLRLFRFSCTACHTHAHPCSAGFWWASVSAISSITTLGARAKQVSWQVGEAAGLDGLRGPGGRLCDWQRDDSERVTGLQVIPGIWNTDPGSVLLRVFWYSRRCMPGTPFMAQYSASNRSAPLASSDTAPTFCIPC